MTEKSNQSKSYMDHWIKSLLFYIYDCLSQLQSTLKNIQYFIMGEFFIFFPFSCWKMYSLFPRLESERLTDNHQAG